MIGPHDHLILAFITSRVPAGSLKTDVVIDASDPEFASTGLRVSSTLQLHRLMTVTKTFLRRELGVLPPAVQAEVQEGIRLLFDLT
jgi:PemK-like protein.